MAWFKLKKNKSVVNYLQNDQLKKKTKLLTTTQKQNGIVPSLQTNLKPPSKLAIWAGKSDDIFTISAKYLKKPLFRKYLKAWMFIFLVVIIIASVSGVFINKRLHRHKFYHFPIKSQSLNINFINHSNSFVKLSYINNKTHYLTKFSITDSEYNMTKSQIASGGFLKLNFLNYQAAFDTPKIITYNLYSILQLQKPIPKNATITIDFEQENSSYQTADNDKPGLIITFSEIVKNQMSASSYLCISSSQNSLWTFTDYYHLQYRLNDDRVLFNSKVMKKYQLPKHNSDENIFSWRDNKYAVTNVNYNFLQYSSDNRHIKYSNPDLDTNPVKINTTNLIISEDSINNSQADFITYVEHQSTTHYNLAKNTLILSNINDHNKNPPFALNLKVEITTIPSNIGHKNRVTGSNKYYLEYHFNLANIIALPFKDNYDTYYYYFQVYGISSFFTGLSFGLDLSLIEGKANTNQYHVLNADFDHTK